MQADHAIHTAESAVNQPGAGDGELRAFKQILEALPAAAAIYAQDQLVLANQRFHQLFGEDAGRQAKGSLAAELEPTEDQPDAGSVNEVEVFQRAAGRWLRLTQSPLSSLQQHYQLLIATDITDQKQQLRAHQADHEQLLSTSRRLSVGEMATTLAHELNQPLAAITNYLSVALREMPAQQVSTGPMAAIREAQGQAERASAIIRRIREFVQAREPRRAQLQIKAIVEAVVRLLKLRAEQSQVKIAAQIDYNAFVMVDRIMIEQVLVNLVRNAIEAMDHSPSQARELTIRTVEDIDRQLELTVADRGAGLAAGMQDKLFTPLATTKPDGMGVGLSICRSIVEFHQGRLFYKSNPGGGSIFGFTLPPTQRRY